jgi:hypothetical protein
MTDIKCIFLCVLCDFQFGCNLVDVILRHKLSSTAWDKKAGDTSLKVRDHFSVFFFLRVST